MIPITENTITAVAALVYNHAYDQDPDCGWMADDPHSAPGNEVSWLEWSAKLVQTLQEHSEMSDKQLLAEASRHVDRSKAGYSWNTIFMHQTEEGDAYSTMTHETNIALPLVRDFLAHPDRYVEVEFLERDPVYLAYLESPIEH